MKAAVQRQGARVPLLLAVMALAAAGCGPAPPQTSNAPPSAAHPPATAPEPSAAAPTAPPAVSAEFAVGEIKTAAQYLEEPRFAGADRARGELLSLACAACHTFGAGEKPIIGPNLYGVFGREAATVPGFTYTQALRDSGLVWTPRAVEAWLAEPARFVPGTSMAFAGYKSAEDRRDLLAYLLQATSNHP